MHGFPADPVKASCTIILSAIGRHGRTKHTVWQRHEFKYFSGCRVSHNDCCSQCINGRLQQNRSNANQTGHQPIDSPLLYISAISSRSNRNPLSVYAESGIPENTNQAQHHRQKLCQHRSIGCSLHSHLKSKDKQIIQPMLLTVATIRKINGVSASPIARSVLAHRL